MQQRQLRLGDILDDYCPRERRVTNHAVVAMVGEDVKQTRCTTCDADHEYKHAKVPRQRRKNDAPAALYAQVAAGAPKRVSHDNPADEAAEGPHGDESPDESIEASVDAGDVDQTEHDEAPPVAAAAANAPVSPVSPVNVAAHEDGDPAEEDGEDGDDVGNRGTDGDGPIHRRLIRASLPRPEGQQPPARPIPEFTIRQPSGRQNRFRPRHQQRGGGGGQQGPQGHQFGGNRSNGNMGGAGSMRGPRPGGGGRPGGGMGNRRGPAGGGGRKRSK